MASAALIGSTSATAIATGHGRRARAQSNCASPSCARAATFRPSWNRAGCPRRRSLRWCRKLTCTAYRTRSVDDLVKAMGMSGISKSQVSRLCEEIDARVKAFLSRPIEGDWPYLWIDATYVKVRQSGRTVSAAVIVAVTVNSDG